MDNNRILGVNYADVMNSITNIRRYLQHKEKEEFEKVILEPASIQNFPIQNPVMNYVIKNANSVLLQKLYLCCKYFFFARPFVIVDKLCLETGNNGKQIISTFPRRKYASQLVNLWLTGSLDVSASDFKRANNYSMTFVNGLAPWDDEKIFKNITQNNINMLSVKASEMSLKNLELLCSSKFLADVNLNVRFVTVDDQNYPASMEQILSLIPHVRKFSMCHCYCTPETTQKLEALKFENKIEYFRFKYIKEEIDPKAFLFFLVKNFSRIGRVEIKFDSAIPGHRRQLLTQILDGSMKKFNAQFGYRIYISFF